MHNLSSDGCGLVKLSQPLDNILTEGFNLWAIYHVGNHDEGAHDAAAAAWNIGDQFLLEAFVMISDPQCRVNRL